MTARTTPRRILVLSPVPIEGAGYRFRIWQYIPMLEQQGFHVTASPFFTSDFFALVYSPGRPLTKMLLFARQAIMRMWELATARKYDLFLIYREAFPIGPPVVEHVLALLTGRAVVYDFDDAIFLPNVSSANPLISSFKWYRKVSTIIGLSNLTIAGNAYLATYARTYAAHVCVVPTSVDTTRFTPSARAPVTRPDGPVVGWIGSHSTTKYLRSLVPVLKQTRERHPFSLYVVGSDGSLDVQGVFVRSAGWTLEREIEDFQACDIGVYPLSIDSWSHGKCGFKAIQFMACGVPVVAAAVGVNCEIIQDGVNGFLAANEREWIEKLTLLLADSELRRSMGAAARQTVEERYSLSVNGPRFVSALREAAERAEAGSFRVARRR